MNAKIRYILEESEDTNFRLGLLCIIALIVLFNAASLCTILTVYVKSKYIRRPTTMSMNGQLLTLNLTISDLAVGVSAISLLMPFQEDIMVMTCDTDYFYKANQYLKYFFQYYTSPWNCRIKMAAIVLPLLSSLFTVFFVAIDRYLAIVFSIKYHQVMKKLDIKYIIFCIWLVSLAIVILSSAFVREPEFISSCALNLDCITFRKQVIYNFMPMSNVMPQNQTNHLSCNLPCLTYFSPYLNLILIFALVLPTIGFVISLYIKIYSISQRHQEKLNSINYLTNSVNDMKNNLEKYNNGKKRKIKNGFHSTMNLAESGDKQDSNYQQVYQNKRATTKIVFKNYQSNRFDAVGANLIHSRSRLSSASVTERERPSVLSAIARRNSSQITINSIKSKSNVDDNRYLQIEYQQKNMINKPRLVSHATAPTMLTGNFRPSPSLFFEFILPIKITT